MILLTPDNKVINGKLILYISTYGECQVSSPNINVVIYFNTPAKVDTIEFKTNLENWNLFINRSDIMTKNWCFDSPGIWAFEQPISKYKEK